MQQTLKQISFTMLFGLLITFVSGFNTLIANENDTVPPTRTDSTSVIQTDTVITYFQACDSFHLAETDSTYLTSTLLDMGHFITRSYTYSEDSLSILDSTVTDTLRLYDISILHSSNDTLRVALCDNEGGYMFADSLFTESTIFTDSNVTELGCDSITTLVLTIHPTYETVDTLNLTLCEHELPYIFNGDTIYAAGSYDFKLMTVHGCDSCVKTVNLSITPAPRDTVNVTICSNEFPFEFDSLHHFDAPGIYDIVRDDTLVCHKITTLNLYSLPAFSDTLYREICDLDSGYFFADSLFTESTIYSVYDATTLGCDSITTLVLEVHRSYSDTLRLDKYVCRYDLPFIYEDSVLTETGDYEIHTQTTHGCDSTVILMHFQVLENVFDTLDVTLCSNEFPFVYDSLHVFDSAGTYTFLHTVDNLQCPDVTTLYLSSKPSYNDTTVVTICSTEAPYIFADSSFTESTVYTHYDSTALGCDSLSTLVLTVNPAYPGYDTMDISVCAIDMPFVYYGDTLTEPGSYDFHLMTEAGCDSTDVTIHLSILETPYDTVSLDICHNNFPFMYYETQIDSAGAYDLRILDSVLCDTMRHLIVNELPIYHDSIAVTVCANESYTVGDSTFTIPGIYDILLQTEAGCDSLITLTLEHYPIYEDSLQSFTICENDLPFVYDGNSYFESDTVVLQYQTINGCDSIVSFALTVLPILYNTDTLQQEICQSQLPYTAFDSVLTAAGTYTYIVPSAVTGCDSVFYLTLIVHDNPAPVITGSDYICQGSNINLMVEPLGQQYLWNNGSTTQMLNITAGGSYTVTVTNEFGCTGTANKEVEMASLPSLHVSGTPIICYGDSSVLTVSGADHYVWETGSNSTSITVHPTTTTNYKVTAYSALSCASTGSYTVMVNALPTPVITGNATVCAGDSTQFTAAGGNQYQWSTQQTGNRIIVSEAGLYTVTITDGNGCRNTGSKMLTVNSRPTIRINGRTLFCQGNTTTISASGAATYEWSSGEQTSSISTPYAGTYTVTGTAANGCTSTATTILTTTQIQATITGNRHFCQGQSTTLTVSGNESYTYRWYDGSTTSSISVSSAGSYSVEVTNALGCTNTISTSVTEYALPTPTITGNASICQGRSTTLRASGGNQYLWDDGSTQAFISVNTTGTYAVTVTNQLGCSASTTHTVIVNPLPEINILTNDNICSGESVNITAHAPSAVTYAWTTGQSNSMINVQPSSTTTYSVLVIDENNCSNTASTTITVNQRPDPYINGTLNICQGSSTTLTAYGGSSYRWSNGQTTQDITVATGGIYSVTVSSAASSACTATTQATVILNPLPVASITENSDICQGQVANLEVTASSCTYEWNNGGRSSSINVRNAGTYTVTVTNTSTGCANTLSTILTVHPLPVVTISGNNVICAGSNSTLTANSTENCSYSWSNGSNNALSTVSAAGTYTVTATNTYQCTSSASVAVTVNALPTPTISGNNLICPNGTTTLMVTPAAAYAWSTGEATRSIVVNPSATSVYTVTVTDANGCQGNATTTVNISEVPNFLITGSSSICAGESTQLTATGNYDYQWSNNSHSNSITVSAGGVYTVTATNAQGCTSVKTFSVTVLPIPIVQISGTPSFCQGGNTQLTANSTGSCSYVWNNGTTNNTLTVTQPGTYSVTATQASSNCTGTGSVYVSQLTAPTPTITGTPTICRNNSATLTATNAAHYQWSTGDTTQSILVTPASSSTYGLTVTDSHGCQGSTGFAINISDYPSINISGQTSICDGQTATLTATQGYQYYWSTNDTTRTIHVSTPGTYRVTAVNSTGCASVDSVTVTRHPLPALTFGSSHNICYGNAYTYSLPADSNISYTWSNGGSGNSITVTSSNVYTVTATNQYGCIRTASDTLYVKPLPSITITGSSTICQGENAILTAHGGTSYQWSNGSNTADIAVFPNATTTYAVTATNEFGCSNSASKIVNVNVLPSISFTGTPYFCEGETTTITVMGGSTYSWSTGDHTNSINIGTAGTYRITVSNTLGCQRSDSIVITSHANPNVSVSGNNPLCYGQSELLMATGAASYHWNTGENSSNILVMPTTTTTYTVTGTDNYGCQTVVSKVVSVEQLPDLHISGITTICQGETVTMTASGAQAYLWSNGSSNSTLTVNQGGTYTVTGTSTSGCQNTESVTVTINPTPFAAINGSNTICQNSSMQLTATGGDAYLWNNGASTDAITISAGGTYTVTVSNTYGCSSTANITVSQLESPFLQIVGSATTCSGSNLQLTAVSTGTYFVWSTGANTNIVNVAPTSSQYYHVTVTNALGCSKSDSIYVNVHPTYHDTVSGSTCQGQTFSQYGFDLPVQSEAGEFFHTRNLQSHFGCDSIVTLRLTVNPLPTIDSIAGATLVSNVGSQLYNVVNPQYTNVIEWRVSNTAWTLNNNNMNSVQLTISGAGTGTLTAKAINNCGFTEKSIFITCNVGVNDYEQETHILLYPNPVSSILNIDLSETEHNIAQMQLYDNLGRCLYTQTVTDALLQLDCTPFADGMYYVKFVSNNRQTIATRKIIIQ